MRVLAALRVEDRKMWVRYMKKRTEILNNRGRVRAISEILGRTEPLYTSGGPGFVLALRSAAERRDSREQSLSQERSIFVTCCLLCMLMG